MILAEALLHALKDHDAREVFGIPGDFALPFFKVIEESAILPLYTLSHEPAVGFAADAAARINGGLGVAAVTYGAGAFNAVNAVAGAYAEKSPVVLISGAPGTTEGSRGLLLHHQAKALNSQLHVFTEITCDQAVLDDPGRAAADIARVLRSCREQSHPVYIELPRDMVTVPAEPIPPLEPSPVDDEAVAACAEEILARLGAAAAPMIMAGVEIRRYDLEDKVARLAGRLNVPVTTSFMGRGMLVSPEGPLIGTYMGLAGDAHVTDAVEGADALLLLGVIVSDTNFGVSAHHIDMRRAIVAADREVRLGFHVYPNVPVAELIDALLERASTPRPGAASRPSPLSRVTAPRGLDADDEPITPGDLVRGINDMFDAHGLMPIACDVGDCLFAAVDIRPTPMVGPGYYATMGFGVPAGLAIQATMGQRPLILVGDGAFQMTGWELGNCRRYGWDPVVVVFNNASWEMLRTFQPEVRYNDLDDWNFAAIADVLGGRGRRVATRGALAEALAAAATERGQFQLIEVMLARGAVSPTLERFAAALKRLNRPSRGS